MSARITDCEPQVYRTHRPRCRLNDTTGASSWLRLYIAPPVREIYAYETHAREMYAHEMYVREMYTYKVHAHEMHAYNVRS